MSKAPSIKEQLDDLVKLDSSEYRLSPWEVNFVDSCEKRTRGGQSPTTAQSQIISKIWDEAFIHGRRMAR